MSIQEITHVIMEFIKNNQVWAIPIIFILALSKSLAIVSLLIPATTILFGTGALIGAGLIPFFPALLAISAGTIIGYWFSYWLGKHYHQKIITSWPLNRYAKIVYRSEQFFYRYGFMSVFIGRFSAPFRAVIPLIAGAMHMSPTKFNIANITSAPLWAFVLLAPGTFGFQWIETLFG